VSTGGRTITVKMHGNGETESVDVSSIGGPDSRLCLNWFKRGDRAPGGGPSVSVLATDKDVDNLLKAIKTVMR
jgi:hypothetical protein